MNDVQIGFSMMMAAVLIAGGIIGFQLARGDKEFGTRSTIALWALGFLWYMGTLAIYSVFVASEGRNAYLAYPVFVVILSAILMVVAILVWCVVFHVLNLATKKYTQIMGVY